MGSYLFVADRNVILRDIGLEQMLYVVFMRRMIVFFLCAGIVITMLILVWARLTTSNEMLILSRILGSRDITLTSLDFNTFVACCYTIIFTIFIISLRKHMAVRLCDSIVAAEEKKATHRPDIWFQVRTIKFRGVLANDEKGKTFKLII